MQRYVQIWGENEHFGSFVRICEKEFGFLKCETEYKNGQTFKLATSKLDDEKEEEEDKEDKKDKEEEMMRNDSHTEMTSTWWLSEAENDEQNRLLWGALCVLLLLFLFCLRVS